MKNGSATLYPLKTTEMTFKINKISKVLCFAIHLLLATPLFAQQQLSLDQCRKLAFKNNKRINAAGYQISAARQDVIGANARSRPTFEGSITGLYLSSPIGGPNGILPHALGSAGLSATQIIYNGNRTKNGVSLARQAMELSQINKTLTKVEIFFEVERTYWQIQRIDEKIVLANKYERMLEGLKMDLQNAFDAGMIYKNDLLRVEVNLNRARLNATKAADELIVSKMDLAQLIGESQDSDLTLTDSLKIDSMPAQNRITDVMQLSELKIIGKQLDMMQVQRKFLEADKLG